MTTIKFSYNDAYGAPSRGSLAFMPHRRHAANETEILPKPFTVPLLNGEATVNLQPNSSSWVWIITEYFENQAKSFYTTIPDRDGIIPHTELVHISPSSLPAAYDAVEPAWWAEMRAYKQTVGETLLKSSEALSEAQQAIETGRESVERTQHNASLAKAYSEQSRDYSYEAKDYRDQAEQWRNEAQEQADRAASGPESAAARSEAAATRAETARDRAISAEDDARVHAAEARADATTAQSASSTAVTARTEATSQADRAETEADRAKGYADDLLAGPSDDADRAETARDAAQNYATNAETYATQAQTARNEAEGFAEDASISSGTAQGHAADAENYANLAQQYAQDQANSWQDQFGPWTEPTMTNGYISRSDNPVMYRETPLGIQLRGIVDPSNNTSETGQIFRAITDKELVPTTLPIAVHPYGRQQTYLQITPQTDGGRVAIPYADSNGYNRIYLSGIIPYAD